jgi:RNA polymerase sigma-70 factor, ECF subfamily
MFKQRMKRLRTGGQTTGQSAADAPLLSLLRAGDEAAFRELVIRYHSGMVGLARAFVSSPATAEEIVQETWVAVLQELGRFEGRSSLKAWIFGILVNRARTRAVRDGRMVLFSEMEPGSEGDEPAVDPSRFKASGFWDQPPRPWDEMTPERLLHSAEMAAHLQRALEELPESQRAVVIMRDVVGHSSEETCNILGFSATNQRVLLHRGRSKIRSKLEELLSR